MNTTRFSEARNAAAEEFLFDLAADGAEQNNLLTVRPDEAHRLKAQLAAWEGEMKPER